MEEFEEYEECWDLLAPPRPKERDTLFELLQKPPPCHEDMSGFNAYLRQAITGVVYPLKPVLAYFGSTNIDPASTLLRVDRDVYLKPEPTGGFSIEHRFIVSFDPPIEYWDITHAGLYQDSTLLAVIPFTNNNRVFDGSMFFANLDLNF